MFTLSVIATKTFTYHSSGSGLSFKVKIFDISILRKGYWSNILFEYFNTLTFQIILSTLQAFEERLFQQWLSVSEKA